MIRLTQVCLLAFFATLGLYIYQLSTGADYGLAFLMMGAAGCLYLLLLFETHATGRAKPNAHLSPSKKVESKRREPACAITKHFSESKQLPKLSPIKVEDRR